MHEYQHQLIIQAQDPDTAGRVVRAIADVERDSQLAWGMLSDRFMVEALASITATVTDTWNLVDTGTETLIVPLEWKQLRGVGHGDAWLQLADICADYENVFCWIAAAVGVGPVQLGLELCFRRGLADPSLALVSDDTAMADLLDLGFVRDEDKQRLFLPIAIPAVTLAKAFEENDFTEAMAPIAAAVTQAMAAKAALDTLIEQVRTTVKRA